MSLIDIAISEIVQHYDLESLFNDSKTKSDQEQILTIAALSLIVKKQYSQIEKLTKDIEALKSDQRAIIKTISAQKTYIDTTRAKLEGIKADEYTNPYAA